MRDLNQAQHASTEQLSAFLDRQADPGDEAFVADHTRTCALCTNELGDLRSVRAMLRAMPTYLPPRSFAIPVPTATATRPPPVAPAPICRLATARRSRLVPLTRSLSAVAAVLCLVLFSADAMTLGHTTVTTLSDGGGAMQITAGRPSTSVTARSAAEAEAARAAVRPGESNLDRPAGGGPVPESAKTSDSAGAVTATTTLQIEYPAAAAAKPAAPAPPAPAAAAAGTGLQRPAAVSASPAPAAAAQSAPAAAPQPKPTANVPAQATVPGTVVSVPVVVPTVAAAVAARPGREESAVAAPAPAPERGSGLPSLFGASPLRAASFFLAMVAAVLLVASLALARTGRHRGSSEAGSNGR